MKKCGIQFVLAPFLPREQPALGVSSLIGVLRAGGMDARAVYLNLSFLQYCPRWLYDVIANSFSPHLFGEVLFAKALWGAQAPGWKSYFADLRRRTEARRAGAYASVRLFPSEQAEAIFWREAPRVLGELYEKTPAIVSAWAGDILRDDPSVVGFSTTFQQNVASLALAKELRQRAPKVKILFGGSNCEGAMGPALASNFDFIDCVVSGEGEMVIAKVIRRWMSPASSLSVLSHSNGRTVTGIPVENMDSLPAPCFDEYVETYSRLGFEWPFQVSAETSRGCWWGAKSHCTFCGLNGATMAYRSKSPSRAIGEMRDLSARYGTKRIMMADNILDSHYISTVFPALDGQGLDLFYEVKANLVKPSLRLMRRAGVGWIQPGLESLSSATLRLIGKGTSAIQNIQLLRWCQELGIRPSWNILYGFPGEDPGEFAAMAGIIPDLSHLPPPSSAIPFRMDRFSPYFVNPGKFGLKGVRPFWSYRYAYPLLPDDDLARLAYFFEFDFEDGRDPVAEAAELVASVGRWDDSQRRGATLSLVGSGDAACIYDTRRGHPEVSTLTGVDQLMLELTDSAIGIRRLLDLAGRRGTAEEEVHSAIERFRSRRWLFEEAGLMVRLVTVREPAG